MMTLERTMQINRVLERAMINPQQFDTPITCWDFTRWLQKELYNNDLPNYQAGASLQEHVKALREAIVPEGWGLVDTPMDGCVVEMSHNIYPHHVGVYIGVDNGVIAHAFKSQTVIISVDTLLSAKIAGWRRFIYYAKRG